MRTRCQCPNIPGLSSSCLRWSLVLLALWLVQAQAMKGHEIRDLRLQTEQMFYHGYDNYIKYAFPEDELRPLSCGPLTRDRDHPERIELNDVLGNYSLTLIDSLSTLAILASSNDTGLRAWSHFENGVQEIVRLYGDGSQGPEGQGERARGFDLDSKVQVFETVIRGLGGLLSAHLFAVGDLPIRGYNPSAEATDYAKAWDKSIFSSSKHSKGIVWSNGFIYNGQLLRLARDLADRLLPAFYTPTGLPYPRVNLRHGVTFYENSPLSKDNPGQKTDDRQKYTTRYQSKPEVTETCSAGAGSLVLEFTTLSRLTGDGRYEDLAKRAFWAVWLRRSEIDLIGAGIDAETGNWVAPFTGIGAGIDSFFEYAFKAYVLLSTGEPPEFDTSSPWSIMDNYFIPLEEAHHSPEFYFQVWQDAQDAIKHHLYRGHGYQHPHYVQADLQTGATRAFWIDSLSAFYPGVLTLAGRIEEATEIHLLATALWTRFSALPERWNVATGEIDNGLGWWGGRPEFIESTYYLYRATKDPWYLHVGEMVLRDIKRRCWTRCGWAGLQDVRTGELQDRMESFFLGETAKYMFLLFDPDHPLNNIDAPFVFTTEGHPLIIPKNGPSTSRSSHKPNLEEVMTEVCEIAPVSPPFSFSSTAARPDIFHAASLARLHLMPGRNEAGGALFDFAHDHPSVTVSDLFSPSNYTFYPWTLPSELVPYNAMSSPMSVRPTLDISFPKLPGMIIGSGSMERVRDGVLLKSIGGLRLGMVQDMPLGIDDGSSGFYTDLFRIQVINNVPLGRDEKVYLSREIVFDVLSPNDPHFSRVRDSIMLDVVIDVEPESARAKNKNHTKSSRHQNPKQEAAIIQQESPTLSDDEALLKGRISPASSVRTALSALMDHISTMLSDESSNDLDDGNENGYYGSVQSSLFKKKTSSSAPITRLVLPAINSIGAGSAPLPDVADAAVFSHTGKPSTTRLTWSKLYLTDELCDHRLPVNVPREYQVLVVKRGGCSFSDKLKNIPGYPNSGSSNNNNRLQLVIVVSYPEHDADSIFSLFHDGEGFRTSDEQNFYEERYYQRPFTSTNPNQMQARAALASESMLVRPHLEEIQMTSSGLPRREPISMIMVGGGEETYEFLRNSTGLGIRRRYVVKSQDVPIGNLYII
ncbi:alpha mannosidase-related protein [Talaromyces pinophilus]|uniref:alpha-1,2-Mannosidase n=1 Tax=Talaromyces pinophilus TaxID=128442 RepID=A0A0B8MZ00_TALPI|nr:alpha mannosidase-related protein [Talaromyces pinophilus]